MATETRRRTVSAVAARIAFDRGVRDGENGVDMHACPYYSHNLKEVWRTGHSVGEINRKENDSDERNYGN